MAATQQAEDDRRTRISQTKRRNFAKREAGAVIKFAQIRREVESAEEETPDVPGRHRTKFHSLRPHKEMAATMLAAGGSTQQAADVANISTRQVKKYYQDADFRERVVELRQIVLSEVQGTIIEELRKRVSPEKIAKMDVMDLLRIYDRTTGGKDKGLDAQVTVVKYDAIFEQISQQITRADADAEVEDFQEYGPEDLLVPGGDSQGD